MVAGIAFQLLTMTLFLLLTLDFVRRLLKMGIPQPYYLILGAMFVSLLAIYIRSIYRTLELTGGWSGHLIRDQPLFIGLDAVLMVVASAVFLVADPAQVSRSAPLESLNSSGDDGAPMTSLKSSTHVGDANVS